MVVGILAMLNDRAGSFIETLKKITKRERHDLLHIYDIPEAKHALRWQQNKDNWIYVTV